jgi:3-methyl-2-oxobutanoate hydroxymethyltransferase
MSLTPVAAGSAASAKITPDTLLERKLAHQPITALTAYDYATARLADESGIDLLLVGDSLAMVVMGLESTLPVTVEEMLHHTRAVRRAVRRAMLVADMPYGSYHVSSDEGVANAARFVKEAGAEAVKVEGARPELVERLVAAEIPVVGHIGLTPQSVNRMGGYKVQGKTAVGGARLRDEARQLEDAGACAVVLEGMPRELAAEITAEIRVPTIGIGAGVDCDGQILVFHDLVNLTFAPPARFVRRYADAAGLFRNAISAYRDDVVARRYPAEDESYHLPKGSKGAAPAAETGPAGFHAPHLRRKA